MSDDTAPTPAQHNPMSATYSPDDNKLRLYAVHRLDPDTYARVKAAGFIWAPKQDLFVAPAWTPSREDLLLELAGEIGDEDTTLVDRAEERSERFSGYSAARAHDATAAQNAVSSLADSIPLGQPILVGHHSERRARKDAERIENGMRKVLRLWDTSSYWKSRAAGSIRAAKYKEHPPVRARRIKGLEADERKHKKTIDTSTRYLKVWRAIHEPNSIKTKDGSPSTIEQRAAFVANTDLCLSGTWSDLTDGKITGEQAQAHAIEVHERVIAYAQHWLTHLANRLAYERAMLADAGGLVADRTKPEAGGACRSFAAPDGRWALIQKVNKVSVNILQRAFYGGRNFTFHVPFDKLAAVMTRADVEEKRAAGLVVDTDDGNGFFLRTPPDPDKPSASAPQQPQAPTKTTTTPALRPDPAVLDTLRQTLRTGVEVVTVPQLFPTPPDLARRMVDLAQVAPGHRVLEPSAGTGNLVAVIINRGFLGLDSGGSLVAVEINAHLVDALRERRNKTLYANGSNYDVRCADFLACNGDLGTFDRIVMNPPFAAAADIQHIRHAATLLKPGGRLVALCANGPRQIATLRPLAEGSGGAWIELPEGTFKHAGTNVSTALLTILAPPSA